MKKIKITNSILTGVVFFLITAALAVAALTIVAQDGFELARTDNATLPRNAFYRPDTFIFNQDEKGWPWEPLSADSFAGTVALKYDFDKAEGENLVSRNFSVDDSPMRIEFFVKPNVTLFGNNPDESVQFLFYRIDSKSTPVCVDEIRYSNETGLVKLERETQITLTATNAGAGWKNITMSVGNCTGATSGYFILTSTPEQYSGWILFDNFKIFRIT